jgi:hypothetical protein
MQKSSISQNIIKHGESVNGDVQNMIIKST